VNGEKTESLVVAQFLKKKTENFLCFYGGLNVREMKLPFSFLTFKHFLCFSKKERKTFDLVTQ
jgi:hypothetical protein